MYLLLYTVVQIIKAYSYALLFCNVPNLDLTMITGVQIHQSMIQGNY